MSTCPQCACNYTDDEGCDFAHWVIPTRQQIKSAHESAQDSGNDEAADAWGIVMNCWFELAHMEGDIRELERKLGQFTVNYPEGASLELSRTKNEG